jgi:uncharacterized protein (DUF1330 family)
MSVYLIAVVKITDDSWVPEYAAKVHDIAARHGGKYLSRSGNITVLEGAPPEADLIALIELPTVQAAQDFANDPEYAPYAKARQDGTNSQLFVIDNTDLARGVPYLPKG